MFTENIKNLCKNIKPIDTPMDIICEGGAFLGFYQNGCLQLVKEMEKQNLITIDRISGVSIGAINGFLYFIDKLEKLDEYFISIKDELIEEHQLKSLTPILEEIVMNIDDTTFDSIQGKLWLTYYDTETCKQIVTSTYDTREKLLETLCRSCFIPSFMSSSPLVERNSQISYIDGITPHIFQDFRNKNVLFLSIAQMDWAKHIIFMKNENRITARIMYGILDAYDFFHSCKNTKICSYVNNWNILNYVFLYGKEYFGFYLVLLFMLSREMMKRFYPFVKDFGIVQHFEYIVMKLLTTILIYCVQ
jgi:hypothetical protein